MNPGFPTVSQNKRRKGIKDDGDSNFTADSIQNQLQEDIANDLISRQYMDLVMGSKNTKAQKQAALAAACQRDAINLLEYL